MWNFFYRFGSSAYRSNQWRYRGRCDAIQFCVDKRVFIVGFGLYGSSNGSSDYSARIELKKSNGGILLASNMQQFFRYKLRYLINLQIARLGPAMLAIMVLVRWGF